MVKQKKVDDVFLMIESEIDYTKKFYKDVKKDVILKVRRKFRENFSDSKISLNARKLFPFFDNLDWIESYLNSIVSEEKNGVTYVYFDGDKLKESGMPNNLPEMLEFGHPIGIQAVKHIIGVLDEYEPSHNKLLKQTSR